MRDTQSWHLILCTCAHTYTHKYMNEINHFQIEYLSYFVTVMVNCFTPCPKAKPPLPLPSHFLYPVVTYLDLHRVLQDAWYSVRIWAIMFWHICYLCGFFAATIREIRTEILFLGPSAVSWQDKDVLFHSTYQQTTGLFTKVVHNKFSNSCSLVTFLKMVLIEGLKHINGKLNNISHHLSSEPRCQDQGIWSKRALERRWERQRLEVHPYDSQGQLLMSRADFHQETLPWARLMCIPANQRQAPDVISFEPQLPQLYIPVSKSSLRSLDRQSWLGWASAFGYSCNTLHMESILEAVDLCMGATPRKPSALVFFFFLKGLKLCRKLVSQSKGSTMSSEPPPQPWWLFWQV